MQNNLQKFSNVYFCSELAFILLFLSYFLQLVLSSFALWNFLLHSVRISILIQRKEQSNFGEETGTSSEDQHGSVHTPNALNTLEGTFTHF